MSSDQNIDFVVEPSRAPLVGEASLPGDKSIGHRAVLFGAMAAGRRRVSGLSGGEDNRCTIGALRALGATITEESRTSVIIDGVGVDGLRAPTAPIDCGNSGTSMRLLAGLLAAQNFDSTLVGDEYLEARPMRRVVTPLQQMGARIDGQRRAGKKPDEIYAPLHVAAAANALGAIEFASPIASAQVKSAILLAALFADGATIVTEPERSRDHSERMLAAAGVPLVVDGLRVTLDPRGWSRELQIGDLVVPGDLSSSAFLLAAATLVPGSALTLRGVGVNPTRTGVLDALVQMGADITLHNERISDGEPIADLHVRAVPRLRGAQLRGEVAVRALDELPLLGALAATADGETIVADAAELRVKESDRIAATVALARAFGAHAEERPDGFVIVGNASRAGAVIESFGDHRIAMAGAIVALTATSASRIRDVRNVATSFPSFVSMLTSFGASIGVVER